MQLTARGITMINTKKSIGPFLLAAILSPAVQIHSLEASWKADGAAVCDTTGDQTYHQLTADGRGVRLLFGLTGATGWIYTPKKSIL